VTMSLSITLKYLIPALDTLRDCTVQIDEQGERIARWVIATPQPTPSEIAAAELPAAKWWRKSAINAEATTRITTKYPLEKQISANLGVYPQAYRDTMASEIASVISASNAACDSVDAATTVAEVDAVTVNWPVI